MTSKMSSAIQLTLALSIFYLGYTIHSATSKIGQIVETYPQVISDVRALSDNLQIDQWLEVAGTLEELLPSAIKSIDEVTSTVHATNQTAASIDAKLPAIIEEFSLYRETVIPPVLSEAKQYRTTVIPQVLVESEGYRSETVPLVIKESQALRQEIPPILVKADEIVEKSQEIAQQATQGAVKGVIMSPIDLIREAGTGLKDTIAPTEE